MFFVWIIVGFILGFFTAAKLGAEIIENDDSSFDEYDDLDYENEEL